MAYSKQNWEYGASGNTPLNPNRLGHIEDGIYNNQNMEILDATDTAPTTFSNGDKYFNTTDNKIYVANNNAWEVLENAVRGIIYIVPSKQKTFYFTGTELISVGGGGGGDSTPIGAMVYFPTAIAPDNWLKCDGSLVLRSEYPELFAVLGISHNEPTDTDSTKFRLPNVKGRTIVGVDPNDSDFNDVGIKLGEKTHKLTADEIPPLNIYSAGDTIGGNMAYIIEYDGYTGGGIGVIPIAKTKLNDNQPHNNLQPLLTEYCYIKAFKDVPLEEEAEVVNTESDSTKKVYGCNYVNNNFESKPVVLYENASGTSGDITLSDSVVNYKYIEIYFKDNNGNSPNSIKFRGSGIICLSTYEYSNNIYLRVSSYVLSGSSLTFNGGKYHEIATGNELVGNYLKIYQVVGYK